MATLLSFVFRHHRKNHPALGRPADRRRGAGG